MGLSESSIKLINDPVNHCLSICGHSHCESECCECFKLIVDTNDSRSSNEASVT